MVLNSRFPVLSFISLLLRVIGWIVVVVGIWIILKDASNWKDGHYFVRSIMSGGVPTLTGVAFVAIGEIIGVLFAIEENTRNKQVARQNKAEDETAVWACPKCKAVNSNDTFTCKDCGYSLR